jgi:hypothetical protein
MIGAWLRRVNRAGSLAAASRMDHQSSDPLGEIHS